MYEFIGFNIALPVAIHCFHPDCAACVKFLYASSVCYDVLYDCVNYISFTEHHQCIWLKDVFISIDRWVSLSHTHKHTHTHTQVGPVELFFARDSF